MPTRNDSGNHEQTVQETKNKGEEKLKMKKGESISSKKKSRAKNQISDPETEKETERKFEGK